MDAEELKKDVERCLALADPPIQTKQLIQNIVDLSYELSVAKGNLYYWQQRCENAEHDLTLLKRRVHRLSADI